MEKTDIKNVVKERYARAALSVATSAKGCCSSTAPGDGQCDDPITRNLYEMAQTDQLPDTAGGRSCWIWDRAAASTFSFLRSAWALPARLTGST